MQILDFPVTGSRRRWLYSTEGSIGSRYDAVIAAVLRNKMCNGQLLFVIPLNYFKAGFCPNI
ncbi:hypothetical protein [Nitrosomonas sp.]|jgi:hypothetical protein|uniref:hypothetical protein n=1 Tax=Nitrosomonas sp. TaxID=42353 RepID=UPI0035AE8544